MMYRYINDSRRSRFSNELSEFPAMVAAMNVGNVYLTVVNRTC